jgi:hypothetical protein
MTGSLREGDGGASALQLPGADALATSGRPSGAARIASTSYVHSIAPGRAAAIVRDQFTLPPVCCRPDTPTPISRGWS